MAKPTEPLSVLAWKLARAQSFGHEVVVTTRTRPVRHVRGLVERRRQDPRKKIDPKAKDRSNLLVTVGGEELEVERLSAVAVRS
jgi:hypothetical protein